MVKVLQFVKVAITVILKKLVLALNTFNLSKELYWLNYIINIYQKNFKKRGMIL